MQRKLRGGSTDKIHKYVQDNSLGVLAILHETVIHDIDKQIGNIRLAQVAVLCSIKSIRRMPQLRLFTFHLGTGRMA